MNSSLPVIDLAQVIQVWPDTRMVTVQMRWGEALPTPIPVLHVGSFDALRIKAPALPARGTFGLVCFLANDPRNAIWLGSIPNQQMDAISQGPSDQFADYESTFSGYWRLLDNLGNETVTWPDGSQLAIGTGAPATTYRHTLDSSGQRQRIQFTNSDRIPNPPSPMPFTFVHKTGTTVQIDANGNLLFTAKNASLDATGNLHVNGDVVADNNGSAISLVQHVHGGVQSGGGETGAPIG